MLARFIWKRIAPYVAQAILHSLTGFYQQLAAAGMLQNVPAQPSPDQWNPQGVRESHLRH